MKIYSTTKDAVVVLQGCALSCDWERWCAQYDCISSNLKELVQLQFSMDFLPTATILLQRNFPPETQNKIKACVEHYLNGMHVAHNSHEILNFCQDIMKTHNTLFQKIGVDLVDTVCQRRLLHDHALQPLVQWVDDFRCQTQRENIARELTEPQHTRNNRKI